MKLLIYVDGRPVRITVLDAFALAYLGLTRGEWAE